MDHGWVGCNANVNCGMLYKFDEKTINLREILNIKCPS